MLSPSNQISPCSGSSCPPIKRKSVVLPIPEGPMIAVTLPLGTCRSMSSKMTRCEREKRRFLMVTKSD
ncbi:Uncharacterised protein [Vibrio cholerae]|uniref:Uncharacterized protein n=1 Tax=Vibrio cholerae TaxID=666 RepID=A0A655ZQM1_VIBCL|nr:Uncharacterised protein [Vibrio cholerae]